MPFVFPPYWLEIRWLEVFVSTFRTPLTSLMKILKGSVCSFKTIISIIWLLKWIKIIRTNDKSKFIWSIERLDSFFAPTSSPDT